MTETHQVKNGMNGWQRAAVIVGVLAAICAPVITVTYSLAERNAKLDGVCAEVSDIKDSIREMRQEIRELRDTVLRIRSITPLNGISNARSVP